MVQNSSSKKKILTFYYGNHKIEGCIEGDVLTKQPQ